MDSDKLLNEWLKCKFKDDRYKVYPAVLQKTKVFLKDSKGKNVDLVKKWMNLKMEDTKFGYKHVLVNPELELETKVVLGMIGK